MPKFMLVTKDRETGEVWAEFFEDYRKAHGVMMDAICGMGYYAEFYAYEKDDPDMDDRFAVRSYVIID